MIAFFDSIPKLILSGCVLLVAATLSWFLMALRDYRRAIGPMNELQKSLQFETPKASERHDGLSLQRLDELRGRCLNLDETAAQWWRALDESIEMYTSPKEVEGQFMTEIPRSVLPYETVVGKRFHAAFYGSVPGVLTGAGLTLTFTAILIALAGVHSDKAHPSDPLPGIDDLINGLSGKFLSSIVALILSIFFTFFEKRIVRLLRSRYEQLISAISDAIPYLSQSRILLDLQRFAALQTVSVSNISADVVDRFVGAFNDRVVPDLATGMSTGVAEKLQAEFRPTMERMSQTLETLQSAIVGLEAQKQDSVTGEIRNLLESLEKSLVQALSRMGDNFHEALTGAASREFGNVQGTLESTRQMLSDMNGQFGAMQAAFASVVARAEATTSDQLKSGKEQTEALTSLMNGLMITLQETADQNLNSVRTQLTMVVGDLSEKVGTLSRDMMAAAENVSRESQLSASKVIEQTGNWSEATAQRLEGLLANIESRSVDFQQASQGLRDAQKFISDLLTQNSSALERMMEASRHVQAYSSGLAGQTKGLNELVEQQRQISTHFLQTSSNVRDSFAQHERLLGQYRAVFSEYKFVFDDLDVNLGKILKTLHSELRDYSQSFENNFKAVVTISNQLVPEISNLLKTQVDELAGQFEELGSVITQTVERFNGRAK